MGEKQPGQKTVVVMGGLADTPHSTREFELQGEEHGYHVVNLTPPGWSITRERDVDERVKEILAYVARHREKHPDEKVILLGQSAGGLAVMRAAAALGGEVVETVVPIDPAMPKGISPLSVPLLKVMWKHAWALVARQLINTADDTVGYKAVIQPGISDDYAQELAEEAAPISGKEAAQLAGFPLGRQPALDIAAIASRVLMVTGSEDKWVSPRGHTKLARTLSEKLGDAFMWVRIPQVGHMPANATNGKETMSRIFAKLSEPEEVQQHQARILASVLNKRK